jgi:DNA-binding ferritin-like protein
MTNDVKRIDSTGSAEEAIEAIWQLVHQLEAIAARLDPLAEELAQVPGEANSLLKKLFEYLGSVQQVTTDTVTKVNVIQEMVASIRQDQTTQTDQLGRIEKMLRDIHGPLTTHIR